MRESLARKVMIGAALLVWATTPVRADFDACLAGLRDQAEAAGISNATFDKVTSGLTPNDAESFLDNQPEFTTPVWDYLAGLVDDERIADGKVRLRQYAATLAAAEQRFGVDRATVVAVWGVESDYGRSIGKRWIVQSLATLSCGGRRQDYFRGEFFNTLKIIQNGDIAPGALMGSWAGAFGQTQFMPSTFLRFAVDLDGDGRRDIVGSIPDALGSTANYLRKSGWTPGLAWGFEVTVPSDYDGPSGRRNKHPMAYWAQKGIARADGRPLGEGQAGLLMPAGPTGPAFLVSRNFDAIFAYNFAESYALAIAHLSDRLRGEGPFRTPWPTDDPGLSRAERKELQTLLARHGYDVGPVDGAIGDKSRGAHARVRTRAGLPADGRPGQKLLQMLRNGQ